MHDGGPGGGDFFQNGLPRATGLLYNRTIMNSRVLPAIVCALLLSLTARADIIHLKTGKIEGAVIKRAEGEVTIRTSAGIEVTVAEKDILGIETRKTPRDVYVSMAAKLKANDTEGHYALATWCRDHGLRNEATAELAAVLQVDPDHERSRRDLGHVKTPNGWRTREEAMREKGLVLVNGKWVTKEEAAKLARQAHRKRLMLAIDKIVYRIHSGPKAERSKWEKKLADLNDPLASAKIMNLLADRSAVVRRAACASLAAMKHRDAVPHVVRRALFDSQESVRSAAVASLLRLDRALANDYLDQTINGLMLQPITGVDDQRSAKRLYRRIAEALQVLGTIRSVPGLISILYPNVQITTPKPQTGGTGLGISRGGGGAGAVDVNDGRVTVGTGVRPQPRSPDKYYFNQAAETALKIITGQNLGVTPKAWRAWWKEHGIELLRKAEAEGRAGKKKADELLDKVRDGRVDDKKR